MPFDLDDGRVILDVVAYDTMFASGGGDLDSLGRFERWTVGPSSQRVDRRVLDTTPQEFPRIDERRFGLHVHDFGDGHVPGEFVLNPAAVSPDEDDGRLVGLVIDTADETTKFVIFDARSFEAAPTAAVRLPHRIPPGFHGIWFSAA